MEIYNCLILKTKKNGISNFIEFHYLVLSTFPRNYEEKLLSWKSCFKALFKKSYLWKLVVSSLVIKVWPQSMQSLENKSMELAKFQNFEKNSEVPICYFTVSMNFFPTCLHATLISCVSSSFFHFLPFVSNFLRKKLEVIPPPPLHFFHSFQKKPISSESFRTLVETIQCVKFPILVDPKQISAVSEPW